MILLWGGVLDANRRRTDNPQDGALERVGDLAYLAFATKPDVSDMGYFFVYGEGFSDTSGSLYGTMYGNGVRHDDTYIIIPPSQLSPCDLVGNPGDPGDTHPDLPDGDVDLYDYTLFVPCMSGPNVPYDPNTCEDCDFDGDGDVDLSDCALLIASFAGDDIPATAP